MNDNAVIYARFSSDRQREASIEGQVRECTEYAKKNNITIVGSYIDRALSASKDTDKRLDFQQMIRDSSKDCLIPFLCESWTGLPETVTTAHTIRAF